MDIVRILLGLALVALGRRLYWLFVGVVGFLIGIRIAPIFLQGQSQIIIILAAVVTGLVGAVLAVFLQQLMIGLAGFLAGGYLASLLVGFLNLNTGNYTWIAFVIGGIIGAALMVALFDWALILLSSLLGAAVVVESIQMAPTTQLILFGLLVLAGILLQAGMMARPFANSHQT